MAKKSAFTDIPTFYNDCYMICNNRKALREKAKEIKQKWMIEAEHEFNQFKEMETINKY